MEDPPDIEIKLLELEVAKANQIIAERDAEIAELREQVRTIRRVFLGPRAVGGEEQQSR